MILATARLRSWARRIGVPTIVAGIRARGATSYEEKVRSALIESLRPGDVVWDVGANVGVYTCLAAGRVGPTGEVHAFEPSPENADRLHAFTADLTNVRIHEMALGARTGRALLNLGDDDLGATTSVQVATPQEPAPVASIAEICRGEDLVAFGRCPSPTILKIDVEGHEVAVLRGLGGLLARPNLRVVLVEVHFRLLEEQGQRSGPKEVVGLLSSAGLNVHWVDSSHVIGVRSQ